MFPAGRHDDQLDALAHGLKYLTANAGGWRWLRTMEEVDRLRGLSDPAEDASSYTVSFDHPERHIEFKVSTGRLVKRAADGLYHVTHSEWQGVQCVPGLTLISQG